MTDKIEYEKARKILFDLHTNLTDNIEYEFTEVDKENIWNIIGIEDVENWNLNEEHIAMFIDGMRKGYMWGLPNNKQWENQNV